MFGTLIARSECVGLAKPFQTVPVGVMYRCTDIACIDYTLCESCMKRRVHDSEHQFLTCDGKEDDDVFADNEEVSMLRRVFLEAHCKHSTQDSYIREPWEDIVVGLRVYTKKESRAIVQGQVRYASVTWLPWMVRLTSLCLRIEPAHYFERICSGEMLSDWRCSDPVAHRSVLRAARTDDCSLSALDFVNDI